MRVLYPALFDAFDCENDDCPCRRALKAAPAPAAKAYAAGQFPYREAERAMLRGAARIAANQGAPAKSADIAGDYPVAALGTPTGAELYFATLCPSVRFAMAENSEPVDLARAEGGWRLPVTAFVPEDRVKTVRLTNEKIVPFRTFAAARERLLDVVADPTLTQLARMARLAHLVDAMTSEGELAATVGGGLPPLTPRMFLSFRGHLEARVDAADVRALATALGKYWPILGDLELDADQLAALPAALAQDWRAQVGQWLAVAEAEVAPAVETYLAVRVFAIPLDRDQTIQRGYAELFESFAHALRLVVALAEVRQSPVAPWQLTACWGLCEALLADLAKPLVVFARQPDGHVRAPPISEMDMTLGGIA